MHIVSTPKNETFKSASLRLTLDAFLLVSLRRRERWLSINWKPLSARGFFLYNLSLYPISGLTEYAFIGPLLPAPRGGQKGANSGCQQAQTSSLVNLHEHSY